MGYEGGTVAQVLAKLQACLDRPEQAIPQGHQRRFYAARNSSARQWYRKERRSRARTWIAWTRRGRSGFATPMDTESWMNSRAIANAHIGRRHAGAARMVRSDAMPAAVRTDCFSDVDLDEWGDALHRRARPHSSISCDHERRREPPEGHHVGLHPGRRPGSDRALGPGAGRRAIDAARQRRPVGRFRARGATRCRESSEGRSAALDAYRKYSERADLGFGASRSTATA
mgnify:CR=1 FL=1